MADMIVADPTLLRFGIGQPVPRNEDPILLTGRGRYTDDVDLPGQAWGVVVRSPFAHGVIRAIRTEAARAKTGVLAIFTAADLAEYGFFRCRLPLKNRDGTPLINIDRPALATDRVRYVGDPVAFVVAETRAQAKDAAEAVELDIEPLPAVTEASAAAAPGAPQLYDHVPGNVVLDFLYGDPERVAEAFARAAHVTTLRLRSNRVIVCPMEPRSAIGEYDAATGRFTLYVGSQGVFGLRNQIAEDILRLPPEKLRVITGHVGGSFGMKAMAYPEYICVLHAAKVLGRPVKWTDERSSAFLSDCHGRDHETEASLALDAEGRFLAVKLISYGNMGAWLSTVGNLMGTGNFVKNVQSNYATPLILVATKNVLTNTVPISAYRGAGRPEANYFMERLIETAARETGRDAVALRRLNHISPQTLPYRAASGSVYDSGNFAAVFEYALRLADWDGFSRRRAESEGRGLRRGRGIGNFLECTAPPMKEQGEIVFAADGTVTIVTGTLDYGQGHWTPLAQILHHKLGIPFERIRLLQGDSDCLIAGGGTGGSKSLMASGAAILAAAEAVIEKGRLAASHILEAAVEDIVFERGQFVIVGTDRSIDVLDLAARLRENLALPPEVPQSLDTRTVFNEAPMAFPNGCHICEVEIDPETGEVRIDRYIAVNDFGVIVNPLLVEGQVHGGIAQGIGQALHERVVYTEEGQLLTGSLMDYGLPRAADLPAFRVESLLDPCRTNPLGVKGCGEAGCAGALSAVVNAVCDALGGRHVDMPLTPERIWRALRQV